MANFECPSMRYGRPFSWTGDFLSFFFGHHFCTWYNAFIFEIGFASWGDYWRERASGWQRSRPVMDKTDLVGWTRAFYDSIMPGWLTEEAGAHSGQLWTRSGRSRRGQTKQSLPESWNLPRDAAVLNRSLHELAEAKTDLLGAVLALWAQC